MLNMTTIMTTEIVESAIMTPAYEMTRDSSRIYFENAELTYADITADDINLLVELLSEELETYRTTGGEHAKNMAMTVRKPLVKDVKVLKTGLKHAYIKVDGSYFEKREGISFNKNGFIGFAGSFDGSNTAPYLTAFKRWVDAVHGAKELSFMTSVQ
jgi:hypothetical protein